jgi:hypothetical protein
MGVLNREDYKDEEVLKVLYGYYNKHLKETNSKQYPHFGRNHDIFRDWLDGATQKDLAPKYGVCRGRIGAIIEQFTWYYRRATTILAQIKSGKRDPETYQRVFTEEELEEMKRPLSDVESLGMSIRATNALKRAGYNNLKDLANISETRFMSIRNLGIKTAKEIKTLMNDFGIEFMPEEEYNEKVKKGTNECLKAYGIKPEDDDDAEEEEAEKDPVDDKVDEVNKTFLEKCLDKMKSQDTIDKIMDEYASDVRKAMAGRRFNSYPWATNNTDNPYVYDCAKAKILRSIINYNDDALRHINHIQLNECSAAAMLNHVEDIHNIITEENIYIIKLREILQKIPTIVIDMPTSVYNMTPLIMGFRMFADIHSFNIRYVVKDIITPRNSPIIIAIPKEMSIQIMNEINYNFSFLCKKYNVGHPVPIEINVAR